MITIRILLILAYYVIIINYHMAATNYQLLSLSSS